MRTLIYTLGLAIVANATVLAQQEFALASLPLEHGRSASGAGTPEVTARTVMPKVTYYEIAEGEDENFPPGLYAAFQPIMPDTVEAFDELTDSYVTIKTQPGREIIHGDSSAVFGEVRRRESIYMGLGTLPAQATSFVSRSGYVPISEFGANRTRFAIKPSHFRIQPNALVSVSVHLEGDEEMSLPLCTVSNIDYEHNTFTVEISKQVPVGETINWVIINFPE